MRLVFSLSAIVLASALLPALAQQPSPAYLGDPKFQKETAAAKEPHQRPDDRLGHWKKANKISGGTCVNCLEEILTLQFKTGEYKDALNTAASLDQVATRPADKAYAQVMRGSAWFYMGHDKPKPEQLQQADAAFKAALALTPSLHTAAYLDGRTLALLNRDDEARTVFADYVKAVPADDRHRLRAQHFAENPALARAKMAPPFTVTTADGKQFTLDDMGGRVVLVDFWATWCGPCNQELPHIKKIAQEFAGQPFVLISVSWDDDAGKWQAFIDKNNMTWNQYRDLDHQLSASYGVSSIPHYFTIDADGVLQAEKIGEGADIEGKLKKLVAQAKAAVANISVPVNSPGN